MLLSGCNVGVEPEEHVGEIYRIALDSVMEMDKALEHDMEFIAIDMSHFSDVSDGDKKEILNYFEDKYNIEVMDNTFEELEEKGFYHPETTSLDGVLLKIEKVEYRFNKTVFFEGSKYRSGLGAVGVEGTVHFKDGNWKVKEANMTWVS